MNKVILMGRLTKNPEVRYSNSDTPMAIARYTLAVKGLVVSLMKVMLILLISLPLERMESLPKETL